MTRPAYRPGPAAALSHAVTRARAIVHDWLHAFAGRAAAAPPPPRQLRPALVPESLSDLHGPDAGTVELPVSLYWSAGSSRFDLADLHRVASLYEAVLGTAWTVEEAAEYVNPALLVQVWPKIGMGPRQRRAWHDRFPELAARHAEARRESSSAAA